MSSYQTDARQFARARVRISEATSARMWELFVEICRHWSNVAQHETMQSRLVDFMANRIEMDSSYLLEYQNAAEVIAELIAERGYEAAYRFLLTDPEAQNQPPMTRLQRARQKVANEFITLQVALGGFRAFTGAINYPGYIAGVNGSGHPYRTAPKP